MHHDTADLNMKRTSNNNLDSRLQKYWHVLNKMKNGKITTLLDLF